MPDISVFGLGVVGSALANTLLQNGYSVTVWNRSIEKADPLASNGATVATSAEEAITASPLTITCIVSHEQTIAVLSEYASSVDGRTIVDLSTGSATEAEALTRMLSVNNASWLLGIINAQPPSIGESETDLTIVGDVEICEKWKKVIKSLGGSPTHVGTEAGMLAALFAALFTKRQGSMFGMIYGGLLCKKAGIPLDIFAQQVPVSISVLPSYYQYFADTVPERKFDNPPATMTTYAAAVDDALSIFKAKGAACELPRLFSDLAHQVLTLDNVIRL